MAATSPTWVFGYGSLIWNPGFAYDARVVGFVRDHRRVFYQGNPSYPPAPVPRNRRPLRARPQFFSVSFGRRTGSTDHRGTPQFPGRTVTLEHQPGATCWGIAYKIREEDKQTALEYLEVREKQYDEKIHLDLYTDSSPKVPAVENVTVYLATTNKESNKNYLGPAPLEEMARQIYLAEGPSGPNKEYVFKLEDALNKLGVVDPHVQELANAVREYSDAKLSK
ncbi:hypothetical protein C2845_PM16G09080 [Panicum miliaceum]|uniref:glutathione-specific gamma-glutamylcyclotransferase n=1 Tax=Panicum miliaceum TaxID=4540 RepID=A0A3L6PYR3_PANMI|nr:hypothetical protein C2845_PM16G09080 [Panicum miliaceum]